MRHRVTARRAATALAVAAAVAATTGLTRAPAGQAALSVSEPPGDCPPVMPVSGVSRGMTGTALSVVQGRAPSTFDVEVVGVLENGIAPGLDLIVVNLSGPVIDATGGLWAGASGSPVYLFNPGTGREELVGALAYGLAFGASTLAGVTPAERMIGLLDPTAPAEAAAAPARIRVPAALALRMAAEADVSVTEAASFERLLTPLSVSGLNARGMKQVRAAIARQNLPFLPYMGSSASLEATEEAAALAAGDSFAAAESLGDVTFAGIGTTTLVCYGQAVAFGHPFSWSGETTLAARAADALTIVTDPLFGSYKLANVAENAGTVTEDRLAGIAADLGAGPPAAPITTNVTDLDSGRTRHGETHVVMPEATPFLAFIHTFQNIDVTIDRIGAGNSEIAFAITGTRDGGRTWRFARTNHYASPFDISFGSVDELLLAAELLQGFEGEDIEITGINVSRLDVEKRYEAYRLTKVLVWNGRRFVEKSVVRARPGRAVLLRIVLAPSHRSGTASVNLKLRVPKSARRGGVIEVRGNNSGGDGVFVEEACFFEDGECGPEAGAQTFDKLLTSLRNKPRNDLVTARLRLGPSGATRAVRRHQMDAVVSGARFLAFELIR